MVGPVLAIKAWLTGLVDERVAVHIKISCDRVCSVKVRWLAVLSGSEVGQGLDRNEADMGVELK